MTPVISDAGPLRYLVLIGAVDVLPQLFGRLLIPETVGAELCRPSTPSTVREWLTSTPAWLETRADPPVIEEFPSHLGAGERAAIGLARMLGNALLLIDDRAGIAAARAQGIEATGTLGVLVRAAQLDLVDLRTAFARLSVTNFRCRQELLDDLLVRHDARNQ